MADALPNYTVVRDHTGTPHYVCAHCNHTATDFTLFATHMDQYHSSPLHATFDAEPPTAPEADPDAQEAPAEPEPAAEGGAEGGEPLQATAEEHLGMEDHA
jgi:hypothetical protein